MPLFINTSAPTTPPPAGHTNRTYRAVTDQENMRGVRLQDASHALIREFIA